MTRAEIFAIWPRPWRLASYANGIIVAADETIVAVAGTESHGDSQCVALAELIIEWSRRDEPQPDMVSGD